MFQITEESMEIFLYKYLLRFVTIQDDQEETELERTNFRQHLQHSLISQAPLIHLSGFGMKTIASFFGVFKLRTMICGEAA